MPALNRRLKLQQDDWEVLGEECELILSRELTQTPHFLRDTIPVAYRQGTWWCSVRTALE